MLRITQGIVSLGRIATVKAAWLWFSLGNLIHQRFAQRGFGRLASKVPPGVADPALTSCLSFGPSPVRPRHLGFLLNIALPILFSSQLV